MTEEGKSRGGSVWRGLKHWMWRYGGGLIMEPRESTDPNTGELVVVNCVSLGRASFLALLCQAMWLWSDHTETVDLPDGMLTVLLGLAAYNFGSKGVDVAKRWAATRGKPSTPSAS